MVRDTIKLEDAVSTITQEYLLEFTSEYGIPESLHPELPGSEEPIVEFLESKVGVYTKFLSLQTFQAVGKNTPQCYTKPLDSLKNWKNRYFWVDERVFPTVMEWRTSSLKDQMPSANMDLFSLISAPNPAKIKTETRPCVTHEVSLLIATANRVIDMEDTVGASESSRTPSILEKSPVDFANEDPPQMIAESGGAEGQVHDELAHGNQSSEDATTVEVVPEPSLEKEMAAMGPPVNKRRYPRRRILNSCRIRYGLDRLHDCHPERPYLCERCRPAIICETTTAPQARHCPIFRESGRRDPDRKCCDHRGPEPVFRGKSGVRETILLSLRGWHNKNLARQVAMGSQLRLRFEQEVRLLEKATAKIASQDWKSQAREEEIKRLDQDIKSLKAVEAESKGLCNQTKNLETLLEAEVDMKKVMEARNAELAKE
uniref:Transposase (Putative), gypsy type n=1 Tax=Tanacetum cinerariifolium TaxID=118510 RepID=A0A6L2KFU4_TANCI|nr:hypothetical protein [Tanacetum cinerariifolium]